MSIQTARPSDCLVKRLVLAALALLAGAVFCRAQKPPLEAYIHDPAEENLEIFWLGPDGQPIRTFTRLARLLAADGRRIHFAANAGIYEPNYIPSGLLVADGKTLAPLNERAGRGNFYLQPNGVFFIEQGRAHVMETSRYAAARPSPRIATQSGPLLLEKGRVHPAFAPHSRSRLIRNGVGVDAHGRAHFLIARHPVNLWEFAQAFKARGCSDALFLDGDISEMLVDPEKIPIASGYAGIFVITKPAR